MVSDLDKLPFALLKCDALYSFRGLSGGQGGSLYERTGEIISSFRTLRLCLSTEKIFSKPEIIVGLI